jgi:hypothetical protein
MMWCMTERLKTPTRRLTSRRKGPKTWAAARAMYEAGWTAKVVAERLDLGVGNIYRRSAAEGWRKSDLPDDPPAFPTEMALDDNEPGAGEAVDARGVARAAMSQAARLVRLGQFTRAAEAARAADMIGRLADRIPDPGPADAIVMEDLRDRIAALGRDLLKGDTPATTRE